MTERGGRPAEEVLAELDELAAGDVDWRRGRAFSLAYWAGPEVEALAHAAFERAVGDNALNPEAFPRLRRLQAEVVGTVAGWLHGGDAAAGVFTSGGTESLLLAVLAARERFPEVERPSMVLPTTAHAAFEKAAHYFGVRSVRVPVADDYRADPEAMAAAVDASTVLVVASAPAYPQGVVDPVADVAAIAAERGVNCHVDACMGGVVLPFAERLGHPLDPWDFRVDGVTSISVDLHKYGYAAKGASVLVHRSKELRRHQMFVTDGWLGGVYGSPAVLGTRSGGPLAAAWAVMAHLGDDGYLRLTGQALDAAARFVTGVRSIDELAVRGDPQLTLCAFGPADGSGVDVDGLAAALWRRGWWYDRQGPPPSLHATVHAGHAAVIDEALADLAASLPEATATGGPVRAYGSTA